MKSNAALEVYNLVHSLSPTEKSYFRKSLTKRSDGKLGDIFEIFNKRASFEEELIRNELKRSYTNPTDACTKLSQAILKAMVNYNTQSNTTFELNHLLSQIQFAYSKELLATCERLVNKGLNLAKKNNQHTYIYLFWEWKSRLPVLGYNAHKKLYELALEEMSNASSMQLSLAQLLALQRGVERFSRWKPLSKEGFDDLLEILNSEAANPASYTGPASQVLVVHANSLIAGISFEIGNWEYSYECLDEHIENLGAPDKLSDKLFRNWLASMNNVMGVAILLYKKKDFETKRKLLVKVLKAKKLENQPRVWENLAHHNTNHKVFNGEYQEAIKELKKRVKEAREGSMHVVYEKETLMHALSIARFMQGDYKGVIADCNEILAGKENLNDRIIIHTTKWIELLSVYHLEYTSLFPNKVLSMKRYLKKLNTGFSWEQDIIKTLQGTFEKPDAEKHKAFKALHQKLEENRNELRVAIRNFDMLLWAEAMSLGKSIGELTVERYNAES